jgi:hypothetical protein
VRTRNPETWLQEITNPTESYTKKEYKSFFYYCDYDQTEENDKIGITGGKRFMQNFALKKTQRKGQFDRSKHTWQNIEIYSVLNRIN